MSSFRAKQIAKSQTTFSDEIKNIIKSEKLPINLDILIDRAQTRSPTDLDEVLAKVTPGALVVDDIDLTKISKPKKKTSRSEGPSSTSSLKRKGTQEVSKLESEETPKKKKRLQKLSEKKTPTAESKETIHHAESTPTKEVKKRKTKTAPIKETQEEETEKVEMEKNPSLASSDSSPASLEATSEGPPVNPEHEVSSQTPEKSKLSPFKPEPPTVQKDAIVEEAAEEDMEDFFKTAASLPPLPPKFQNEQRLAIATHLPSPLLPHNFRTNSDKHRHPPPIAASPPQFQNEQRQRSRRHRHPPPVAVTSTARRLLLLLLAVTSHAPPARRLLLLLLACSPRCTPPSPRRPSSTSMATTTMAEFPPSITATTVADTFVIIYLFKTSGALPNRNK
ncbi:hypothetical protein RHGRI_030440 [Rhododendron griersonianum]|uniref:Uncharacterized protein n=1 Tax=Rhododendron griersonianum TaxID=479676 RepID=A0AAV6IP54_9ERIC|nr:hypothetical protein RHGRI_030440 [Rhododendron griersonianum]